jgi:hypothetical protein
MRTNDNFSWRPERSLTSRSVKWIVVAMAVAGVGFWLGRSVPEADRVVAEAPGIQGAQRPRAEPAAAKPSTGAEMPAKSTPPKHAPSQAVRSPPVILLNRAPPSKDGSTVGAGGRSDSGHSEESQVKRPAVNYEALRAEMLAEH